MGKGGGLELCCLEASLFGGMGRRICGCIAFVFLSGPVLFIVGIVLIAGSGSRDSGISQYNFAVDNWVAPGGGYDKFTSLLGFEGRSNGGMPIRFFNDTMTDPILDRDSDIRTYDKYLKYTSIGEYFMSPAASPAGQASVLSFETGLIETMGITSYLLTSLSRSDLSCTSTCVMTCQNRGGYWSNTYEMCYLVQYVTDVCMAVNNDGTITSLCYPVTYGNYEPDYAEGFHNNQLRTIPPITVVVRSIDDPYIDLYSITWGTFHFGASAGSAIGSGIACIIIGLVIMASIGLVCYVLFRKGKCVKKHKKKKKKMVVTSIVQPEVTTYSQTYAQQQPPLPYPPQPYPQQPYPQQPYPQQQYPPYNPQQPQQPYPQQPYPQQPYPPQPYPQQQPQHPHAYPQQQQQQQEQPYPQQQQQHYLPPLQHQPQNLPPQQPYNPQHPNPIPPNPNPN